MISRSGCYVIINQSTGKLYVGSAGNISKRWSRHKLDLRAGKHHNMYLQLAWNKYGEDDFVFRVLEFTDKDQLVTREQHWMNYYDSTNNKLGYNLQPPIHYMTGRKWTELERLLRMPKMIEATKRMNTPEAKAKSVHTARANASYRNQKLDWTKVCEIREKYGDVGSHGRNGRIKGHSCTIKSLAKEYGVGEITIYDVIRWKNWKTEPPKQELAQLVDNPEELRKGTADVKEQCST